MISRLRRLGLRRLGLQRRIMAYVVIGLTVMFGSVAFLGLRAIDRASQLVYEQRLATAHSTAAIIDSDLARIAANVGQTRHVWLLADASDSAVALLAHLRQTETSFFLAADGVWLVDGADKVRGSAGAVRSAPASTAPGSSVPMGEYRVLPAVTPDGGFGAQVIPLPASDAWPIRRVIVHLAAVNRPTPYVPSDPDQPPDGGGRAGAQLSYQLEVVSPTGTTLLGIGPHEEPGEVSRHYPAIREVVAQRDAATLLHEAGEATVSEDHVMAIVPLKFTPYFLILEQPQDVALALPLRLRDELVATIGLGFVVVLAVTWVTTRHVVRPTEQLTAAAKRMAEGDLASPVVVLAEDEISILADSLEIMRGRLNDAYRAVERTNRELESRVAERTSRLERVLRTTLTAQEDERHRLARELHDDTSQTLAALLIALDQARDGTNGSPQALGHIRQAREIAARALAETRRLILGLRPSVLDDLGLTAAIRWQVDQLFAEQEMDASIRAKGLRQRLPSHIEVAVFRVVQEAVTNVARHADARHLRISLARRDDILLVEVTDDGRGFDVDAPEQPGREHVGLVGMRERIGLIGGKLTIRSGVGEGTTVTIELPITESGAPAEGEPG